MSELQHFVGKKGPTTQKKCLYFRAEVLETLYTAVNTRPLTEYMKEQWNC